MFVANLDKLLPSATSGSVARYDPRAELALRLPAFVQPFLTWLTAKPAPGEPARSRSPMFYVLLANILLIGGCCLSGAALLHLRAHPLLTLPLLFMGLTITTSGLGLIQVGLFHHCAHNAVFREMKVNLRAGRLISALLLFKYFDSYKREHMMHHSPKILFTAQDEFSDFVVNICNFSSGTSRAKLWSGLLLMLISPAFHMRFMARRIRASLGSENRLHNMQGIGFWTACTALSVLLHLLPEFIIAVLLPLTVLLQIATIFRILCEHRVPDLGVIHERGRALVCQATAGVLAGANLPRRELSTLNAVLAWSLWWANMLTVQLFVRVFVLVGDAPCHDFHHRRPGQSWTNYIHGRQADLDAGCPGFPHNYAETWGLFRAIDENFKAMANAPVSLLSSRMFENEEAELA